jgi:hypothetical protein
MRILGFIIILSLTVAGYASAAKAFGLVQACDPAKMAAMHMMDCCDHDKGQPVHPNCLKCDCCTAAVLTHAIIVASAVPLPPPSALPDAAPGRIALSNLLYPQLRPPNSVV